MLGWRCTGPMQALLSMGAAARMVSGQPAVGMTGSEWYPLGGGNAAEFSGLVSTLGLVINNVSITEN